MPTDREKRLIDNYITSIPEYDDYEEDEYGIDQEALQYELFKEDEYKWEKENEQ